MSTTLLSGARRFGSVDGFYRELLYCQGVGEGDSRRHVFISPAAGDEVDQSFRTSCEDQSVSTCRFVCLDRDGLRSLRSSAARSKADGCLLFGSSLPDMQEVKLKALDPAYGVISGRVGMSDVEEDLEPALMAPIPNTAAVQDSNRILLDQMKRLMDGQEQLLVRQQKQESLMYKELDRIKEDMVTRMPMTEPGSSRGSGMTREEALGEAGRLLGGNPVVTQSKMNRTETLFEIPEEEIRGPSQSDGPKPAPQQEAEVMMGFFKGLLDQQQRMMDSMTRESDSLETGDGLRSSKGMKDKERMRKMVAEEPSKVIAAFDRHLKEELNVFDDRQVYGPEMLDIDWGSHKTLKRMFVMLCKVWSFQKKGQHAQAQAQVAQSMKAVVQAVASDGKWQNGAWEYTLLPDPFAQSTLASQEEQASMTRVIKERYALEKAIKEAGGK